MDKKQWDRIQRNKKKIANSSNRSDYAEYLGNLVPYYPKGKSVLCRKKLKDKKDEMKARISDVDFKKKMPW